MKPRSADRDPDQLLNPDHRPQSAATLTAVKPAQKGSILVVDDDPDILSMLQIILDYEGFYSQGVGTSNKALELLHSQPFDLVITDMYLQGSNCSGLELIEMVLKYDDTIPVILITGYPSINRAVDAIKRGAVDFLVKPFDRDILLHQVHKAIQERQLRIENRRLQAEANKTAVIEKLNRELNNRINELTRLYAITEGLNNFMDSNTLFQKIASLAAQVTSAQRVTVMLLDRSRRFLKIRASVGVPPEVVASTLQPVGRGIAGKVVQTKRLIRMTQRALDPKAAGKDQPSTTYRSNSWLSLPLMIGQEIFGVINLTDKLDRSDFVREDEQIMLTLVEKAGIKLENQALYEGIYSNLIDTLNALVTSIEAKDPYTHEHSQRVTEYAIALARHLGFSEDQVEMLNFAGKLHDIGKIGVRDSLLTKSSKLTSEEYAIIKLHPLVGERIVKPLGLVREEQAIIRHHHERFDGHGYPDSLAGEAIPLLARIVAVADSFDAMTTTRSYRQALPVEAAIEEMKRCSGTQFDPTIVAAMIDALETNVIIVPGVNLEPICTIEELLS